MLAKVARKNPLADPRLSRETQILDRIYRSKGMTRASLSEATGLGSTVVVRLVSGLVERGLLTVESKVERSSRGRPSELLRIHPEAGHVMGLEFGREHLIVVIADATGDVRHWRMIDEAPPFVASEATVDSLAGILRAEAAAFGVPWSDIRAVGLALHDIVDADGRWMTQGALDADPLPIAALLEKKLQRVVLAEDVSRAFALAEHRYGAARGKADAIYLFVGGHGVGSGIFVNGELLRSSSGVCGEIGHLVVDPDGPLCICGSHGCLETVASHGRVVARFLKLAAAGVATSIDWRGAVDFATICRAARDGDKAAYLVLEELVGHLGSALASVVNISGATHIVIGGQLSSAGDPFLNGLMSELRRRVLALLARRMSVSFAALPGHAGAWGVAVQALEFALADGHFLTSPPAAASVSA